MVERKRTPAEIREEYERLQREREERRLQQRTNPKVCLGKDKKPHSEVNITEAPCAEFLNFLIDSVSILDHFGRERLAWVSMPRTFSTGMKRTMKMWLEVESRMWRSTKCTYHSP